jgi:hypothetical protein
MDDNREAVIAVLGWPAALGGAESRVKYTKATLFNNEFAWRLVGLIYKNDTIKMLRFTKQTHNLRLL